MASLISGLVGALGSLFGGAANNNPSKAENQLYTQEAQQMAQMFPQFMGGEQQLSNFYTPYMQQGNPFLQNIQAASAAQNAQQYNNVAGQTRGQLQNAGMGYGPSGTMGATMGGMGAAAANNASGNYLQNLLSNENMKFQAATGLQQTTNAMKPGQPATVGGGFTPSGLPGAIQGAGNALSGINWGQVFGGGSSGGSAPATGGIAAQYPSD